MTNEEIIESSLRLIESWVEDGLTDKDIAEKLDIAYSTFKRHKTKNANLKQAIAQGKDKRNQKVEQSLYKCCIGYSYYEEVATKIKEEVIDENTNTVLVKEDVKVVKVKKYKGPDLAAQRYWLNNKKKADWKDDVTKDTLGKKGLKLKEKELESKEY